MDIYQEEVMDHYEHPRNQGELTGKDVVTARDANASCGDIVQYYVRLHVSTSTRQHVIQEVKWKGIGCAITTAAASKLSEYLQGRTLQELREMSDDQLLKQAVGFEVNPGRMKCLTLPIKVVRKILGS